MNIPIRRGQVYGRPVTLMLGGFITIPKHPAESAIARSFQVEIADIHRHCRSALATDARLGLYQLLNESGWTNAEIAKLVNRDRGAVYHGIRASRDREETDPQYREKLNAARAELRP